MLDQLYRAAVHALAQRRAGGQQADAQGLLEERVAAKVLDGVEVALALREQAQVAAYDVAAGHAGAHRQSGIDAFEHGAQPLQMLAHQRQAATGVRS